MATRDQIDKADETVANAFEATKRVYDLVFIAWEKLSAELAEQLNLKANRHWDSTGQRYLNRYGKLTQAEREILRRLRFTDFTSTQMRQLPDNKVPFILFSIANKKFKPPLFIYGILSDIDWGEGQKVEIEPFMYEISEKRGPSPLEVSGGVTSVSKKGSANAEYVPLSLFEITDDTIGDITRTIIDWFNKRLQ